jgi:hypothetical protein
MVSSRLLPLGLSNPVKACSQLTAGSILASFARISSDSHLSFGGYVLTFFMHSYVVS